MDDLLPEDWKVLRNWLPEGMPAMARESGFMRRARGVQDVEVWLRLILLHVGGGLSLEQAVTRAAELGWAEISAVALHKRLLKAGPWLQRLTTALLTKRATGGPAAAEWRRDVVVVDATAVHEPGSTGTDWRVHYRVRLSDLRCEHYELTDAHEGECLGRHAFRPEQIVLADRGYCHRAGAAHVLDSGAQLVLRLHPRNFPLELAEGTPLDLCRWARSLRSHRVCEREVWFTHQKRRHKLRLCAVRKSRTATLRAQKRQREKASRMGATLQSDSLELAGYVLVLTALPAKDWPASTVLNLYRHRWQVELVFKRLKSLLGLGHLPKTNDQSARSWMQAKILTALLIERAMHEARFFSPWGFPLHGKPLGSVPRNA
jgi:hypothetical protein